MEPKPTNSESKSAPANAWLFDVDGVLTNPAEKRVMHPEIFDEIIKRLEKGEPVGLNTGRSIDFVAENILAPLEERVTDKTLLNNVFAIGEKGGVWITYKDGERTEEIDQEITVPAKLIEETRRIVEEDFSDIMFFDDTKRTMISVEMQKSADLQVFGKRQAELIEALKKLIAKYPEKELKIDPTTIATDIENIHVGKALGARRFLRMLEVRGINPAEFTAFGDSASDFEMYDELLASGKKAKFVFVGKNSGRDDIEVTHLNYDAGTLDYLQKN
jgi:hydroxymethylpyrimidine pyrophosphatase-like HAD family hydrolase